MVGRDGAEWPERRWRALCEWLLERLRPPRAHRAAQTHNCTAVIPFALLRTVPVNVMNEHSALIAKQMSWNQSATNRNPGLRGRRIESVAPAPHRRPSDPAYPTDPTDPYQQPIEDPQISNIVRLISDYQQTVMMNVINDIKMEETCNDVVKNETLKNDIKTQSDTKNENEIIDLTSSPGREEIEFANLLLSLKEKIPPTSPKLLPTKQIKMSSVLEFRSASIEDEVVDISDEIASNYPHQQCRDVSTDFNPRLLNTHLYAPKEKEEVLNKNEKTRKKLDKSDDRDKILPALFQKNEEQMIEGEIRDSQSRQNVETKLKRVKKVAKSSNRKAKSIENKIIDDIPYGENNVAPKVCEKNVRATKRKYLGKNLSCDVVSPGAKRDAIIRISSRDHKRKKQNNQNKRNIYSEVTPSMPKNITTLKRKNLTRNLNTSKAYQKQPVKNKRTSSSKATGTNRYSLTSKGARNQLGIQSNDLNTSASIENTGASIFTIDTTRAAILNEALPKTAGAPSLAVETTRVAPFTTVLPESEEALPLTVEITRSTPLTAGLPATAEAPPLAVETTRVVSFTAALPEAAETLPLTVESTRATPLIATLTETAGAPPLAVETTRIAPLTTMLPETAEAPPLTVETTRVAPLTAALPETAGASSLAVETIEIAPLTAALPETVEDLPLSVTIMRAAPLTVAVPETEKAPFAAAPADATIVTPLSLGTRKTNLFAAETVRTAQLAAVTPETTRVASFARETMTAAPPALEIARAGHIDLETARNATLALETARATPLAATPLDSNKHISLVDCYKIRKPNDTESFDSCRKSAFLLTKNAVSTLDLPVQSEPENLSVSSSKRILPEYETNISQSYLTYSELKAPHNSVSFKQPVNETDTRTRTIHTEHKLSFDSGQTVQKETRSCEAPRSTLLNMSTSGWTASSGDTVTINTVSSPPHHPHTPLQQAIAYSAHNKRMIEEIQRSHASAEGPSRTDSRGPLENAGWAHRSHADVESRVRPPPVSHQHYRHTLHHAERIRAAYPPPPSHSRPRLPPPRYTPPAAVLPDQFR